MALERRPMVSVLPPCSSWSEEKAIHSLSGDQFGIVSVHSPSVKHRRYFSSPSSASIIHRFLCPPWLDLKTMYFPSGEIAGKALFFVPGLVSNVTARFFSPGFKSIVSTSWIARMCSLVLCNKQRPKTYIYCSFPYWVPVACKHLLFKYFPYSCPIQVYHPQSWLKYSFNEYYHGSIRRKCWKCSINTNKGHLRKWRQDWLQIRN